MKNKLICTNCGTENPIYSISCSKCNSFIRKRTINIDFWQTIWRMLYSPVDAATDIIYAEHKNFTLILFALVLVKIFLLKTSLVYIFDEYSNFSENILNNFSIQTALQLGIFLFVAIVHVVVYKLFKLKSRFRDNFTILVFSFSPLLISLTLLTPVEYALFGKYWFFSNPIPTLIKPTAAWILYAMEILMVFWSFLIYIGALFAQSRNLIYSILSSCIIFAILVSVFYFLP